MMKTSFIERYKLG